MNELFLTCCSIFENYFRKTGNFLLMAIRKLEFDNNFKDFHLIYSGNLNSRCIWISND